MKKRRSPFLIFLCCVFAAPTCAVLVGELVIPAGLAPDALIELLRPWVAVGTLLGLAHVIVRPVLRLLTAPLGCLTLGLFGLVIDVALIYGCAHLVEEIPAPTFIYSLLTAICINAVTAIAGEWRK